MFAIKLGDLFYRQYKSGVCGWPEFGANGDRGEIVFFETLHDANEFIKSRGKYLESAEIVPI